MQFEVSVTNGLTTIQPAWPAVRSMMSMADWPLIHRRIFVAAIETELQAGNGRPCGFQFRASHRGVHIHVHGGSVDDLRYLIIPVLVEEDIAVEDKAAVEQRVLRAEFEGVVEFRLEGGRVRLIARRCYVIIGADSVLIGMTPGGLAPPPL